MMKSLKTCFVILMTLTLSSCDEIKPPIIEQCVELVDYKFCIDKRLDEPEQEYGRLPVETKGYICTNPDDFFLMQQWMDDKLEELEKLRRRCGRKELRRMRKRNR